LEKRSARTLRKIGGVFHRQAPPPCIATSPGWAKRVERLSLVFSENPNDFDVRPCGVCGKEWWVNRYIYATDEPFCCGDSLYDPTPPRRDGYWYAIAMTGKDPELPGGVPASPERLLELKQACEAKGLPFDAHES